MKIHLKYKQCLLRLSKLNVGDVVRKGSPSSIYYAVITHLRAMGYCIGTRSKKAIIIKKTPYDDVNQYSDIKKGISISERNKLATAFWRDNYSMRYKHDIPSFHAVRLFISKSDIGSDIKISDIEEFYDGAVSIHSIRFYIYEFSRIGVIDNMGHRSSTYKKIKEIPENVNSFRELKETPSRKVTPRRKEAAKETNEVSSKGFTRSPKNEFIYELAAKAGLIK